MRLPCEMVQDLLPLYHDGVCSEVSNTLVGEHLKECDGCTRMLKKLDAEIEVPQMEADAAKPRVEIKVKWNKEKRRMLLRCMGAAVLAFVLLVAGWWGLTQWCVVPLKGSDYEILDRYVLSDGTVYVSYTWEYGNCATQVGGKSTDDGKEYHYRLRPVLGKTDEAVGNTFEPKNGLYFLPEENMMRTSSGELMAVQEMYLGTPGNCILLWERGMELPAATAEQEAEYQELLDAFAAPNAPEKADVLNVHYEDAGMDEAATEEPRIEETVVCGTGE